MTRDRAAEEASEWVLGLCAELGFALAGVCCAAPSSRAEAFVRWLGAGKHGSMAYLQNHLEQRLDIRQFLPGARAVVMVADRCWATSPEEWSQGPHLQAQSRKGLVARYARGRDYHRSMKRRLHRLCDALREEHPAQTFRAFVDTAPVLEREHAARAGLGWIGKHTLLIHPKLGSHLLLGGVATTLELAPTGRVEPDHCGSCTRCIDACPTGAIEPYTVDARRCLAYLTIEAREPTDPQLHSKAGPWLFGCDICQEVCPHNRPRDAAGPPVHPDYAPRRDGFDVLETLDWTEADRRRALEGSAMKRATLAMLKRNALHVAAALLRRRRDETLRRRVEALAQDAAAPAMVREAAAQALSGCGS